MLTVDLEGYSEFERANQAHPFVAQSRDLKYQILNRVLGLSASNLLCNGIDLPQNSL